MKEFSYKKLAFLIIAFMSVVTLVIIGCVIYFGNSMFRILEEGENEGITGKHYAFICETGQEGFYGSIYEGAREEAEKNGDYLENMGENIAFRQDNKLLTVVLDFVVPIEAAIVGGTVVVVIRHFPCPP